MGIASIRAAVSKGKVMLIMTRRIHIKIAIDPRTISKLKHLYIQMKQPVMIVIRANPKSVRCSQGLVIQTLGIKPWALKISAVVPRKIKIIVRSRNFFLEFCRDLISCSICIGVNIKYLTTGIALETYDALYHKDAKMKCF